MTVLDAHFTELSMGELEGFARDQSDRLAVRIAPERLTEVVENLTILQSHARTFLSAQGASDAAGEGQG